MRKLLLTPSALTLVASPAFAGSTTLPPQPVVLPPIQVTAPAPYNWSGAYAGISAGTTRSKHNREWQETRHPDKNDWWREMERTDCGGEPDRIWGFSYAGGTYSSACKHIVQTGPAPDGPSNVTVDSYDTPVVTNSGSETYRRSHATWGLFAGYRHQFGTGVVLGAETAWHSAGAEQIEVKGQIGYALGRALPFAIAGWEFESAEPLYGVGIDYGLTSRITAGTEYVRFGDSDRLTARLAWRF